MRRRSHLHLVIAAIGLSLFTTATAVAQQLPSARTNNQQPCVVVMGAVPHATQVELRRPLRLMEALFLAGGLTEGVGETVKIVHGSPKVRCAQIPDWAWDAKTDQQQSESYSVSALKRDEESANPSLLPGDIIIVSYAPSIYIVGNVANPREIFPKKPLTLTQVLDLVGGALPRSRTDKIKIYRLQPGNERVVITVDLGKIKKRRAVDPVLHDGDIVDIPAKFSFSTDRLSAGIVPGLNNQ